MELSQQIKHVSTPLGFRDGPPLTTLGVVSHAVLMPIISSHSHSSSHSLAPFNLIALVTGRRESTQNIG